MRIISGNKKGKKIILPDPGITRPLKDNVKENIFNILKHSNYFKLDFTNLVIFDFFAGSGSFGMECLSRDSRFVIFLENNKKTLNVLYRNLSNNFDKKKFLIMQTDFFNTDINTLVNKHKPKIIFFDPPYEIKNFNVAFKKVSDAIINNSEVLLIVHIKKDKKFEVENLKILQERIYGISKIIFLKFKN